MKNLRNTLIATSLLSLTVACGSEAPTAAPEEKALTTQAQPQAEEEGLESFTQAKVQIEDLAETNNSVDPRSALYLASKSEMPNCDEANETQIAFVASSKSFYACQSNSWVEIDVTGESGKNGEKGEQGEKGQKGDQGLKGETGATGAFEITKDGDSFATIVGFDPLTNTSFFRTHNDNLVMTYDMRADDFTTESQPHATSDVMCIYTDPTCTSLCLMQSEKARGFIIYDGVYFHGILKDAPLETISAMSYKGKDGVCKATSASISGYRAYFNHAVSDANYEFNEK